MQGARVTWVRLSDKKHREEALRLAGPLGKLLWHDALGECAGYDDGAGRDGVLSPMMIRDAANLSDPSLPHKRLTPKLVELGLWHDVETVKACEGCMARGGGNQLAAGQWLIHEWWGHLRPDETPTTLRWRSQQLRDSVISRYGAACVVCGCEEALQIDHVRPIALGGTSDLGNLTVLCGPCNKAKGTKTWQDWKGVTFSEWLTGKRWGVGVAG